MTDNDRRQTTPPTNTPPERDATTRTSKRPYQAPALTAYGSVDDLVDSGVVGSASSVPTL